MSNRIPHLHSPLVDSNGFPRREFLDYLSKLEMKVGQALDLLGQLSASVKVSGRTEPLKTTVQNMSAAGKLQNAGVGFSTDPITDGIGSPLTGGKRGFVALDINNRLASSLRYNQLNSTAIPVDAANLSNDGVSTVVPIASNSTQYGFGNVANNLGTVDPGSFGTYYVFADDPTFAGGALIYQFSTNVLAQGQNDGRASFGKITSAGGIPHTGGGYTGGDTPNGRGGKNFL